MIHSEIRGIFTSTDEEEEDAITLKLCPGSRWQHRLTHPRALKKERQGKKYLLVERKKMLFALQLTENMKSITVINI